MPEAVSVLRLSKDSFEIDAPAFKSVLDKVGNRSFALLSINGSTRTGKSYILSHFIRYFEWKKSNSNGSDWYTSNCYSEFKWRSGRVRETMGINLWSEPYFVRNSNGEEIAVLLMDTQGLFDQETTPQQNAIIFSFSCLCSSVMIFNVMGKIEENILQQVDFFSGYANMAPVYEEKNQSTSSTCYMDGNKFLFLVRDFDLIDYEYGLHAATENPRGSKNYYRDSFIVDGSPEENKTVRKNIQRNFRDVSVYCLPDPGKNFRRQSGKDEKPDEDFQENVIAFVERMVREDNLVKKTVLGKSTTGLEFQKYIDNWSTLCANSGNLFPEVRTMADNAAFTQYSMAMNIAVSHYKDKMDEFIMKKGGNATLEDIERAHESYSNDARALFKKSQKMSHAKYEEQYSKKLEAVLKVGYEKAIRRNNIFQEDMKRANKDAQIYVQLIEMMRAEMDKERAQLGNLIRGMQDSQRNMFNEMQNANTKLAEEINRQNAPDPCSIL